MMPKAVKILSNVAKKKDISVLKEPWLLAYRYISTQLPKVMPYFQELGPSLQKAGIKISLEAYVSLTLFVTGLSFVATLGVTLVVAALLGVPLLITVLFAFGVGIASAAGSF